MHILFLLIQVNLDKRVAENNHGTNYFDTLEHEKRFQRMKHGNKIVNSEKKM